VSPSLLISHRDDPRRLGAAIYGLVVVVSLLAVYGNDTGKSMLQIAGGIVVTAVVFWLAHVYTGLVEHRRERGHSATLAEVRTVAREDLPLVTITLLPSLVLLIGGTGLIERDTAITIATVLCLTELFLVGSMLQREEGGSPREVIFSGCITLSFGLVVILLKALIH
jgi:hypothetical protein